MKYYLLHIVSFSTFIIPLTLAHAQTSVTLSQMTEHTASWSTKLDCGDGEYNVGFEVIKPNSTTTSSAIDFSAPHIYSCDDGSVPVYSANKLNTSVLEANNTDGATSSETNVSLFNGLVTYDASSGNLNCPATASGWSCNGNETFTNLKVNGVPVTGSFSGEQDYPVTELLGFSYAPCGALALPEFSGTVSLNVTEAEDVIDEDPGTDSVHNSRLKWTPLKIKGTVTCVGLSSNLTYDVEAEDSVDAVARYDASWAAEPQPDLDQIVPTYANTVVAQ